MDPKSTKTAAADVIFVHGVFGPNMPAGGVIHSDAPTTDTESARWNSYKQGGVIGYADHPSRSKLRFRVYTPTKKQRTPADVGRMFTELA